MAAVAMHVQAIGIGGGLWSRSRAFAALVPVFIDICAAPGEADSPARVSVDLARMSCQQAPWSSKAFNDLQGSKESYTRAPPST